MSFQIFNRSRPDHISSICTIWNNACGEDLAISADFISYNTLPLKNAQQEGRLLNINQQSVGFILCSVAPSSPQFPQPGLGWIDAIGLLPEYQKKGHGKALIEWAENWLKNNGCHKVTVGGSIRPFTAGLPAELQVNDFFYHLGYINDDDQSIIWDLARDLGDGEILNRVNHLDVDFHPVNNQEIPKFYNFLKRSFPHRWMFEVEQFILDGGRTDDFLVLEHGGQIEGFCWVTLEDSLRPLNRYYLYRLPKPWGQLGTVGISEKHRGKGWGGLLVQYGLDYLMSHGVHGCVIDWTSLLDFYSKFGFKPYRKYSLIEKYLSS